MRGRGGRRGEDEGGPGRRGGKEVRWEERGRREGSGMRGPQRGLEARSGRVE